MKLTVKRVAFKSTYTIGRLYIDGKYFCDTLEDKDRGLTQNMPIAELKAKKVKGDTCIPYGTYSITLDVVSSKYSNFIKYPYMKVCNGKVPRLLSVPGYEGILIHAGNTNKDTEGCILVGQNKEVGKVLNSQATWTKLYKLLLSRKAEKLTIDIVKQ